MSFGTDRKSISSLDRLAGAGKADSMETELTQFFNEIISTLDTNKHLLSGKISDKQRKTILDGLGEAGSNYRTTIYKNGFSSNKANISKSDLLKFISTTKLYIDHTIKANKRGDNLYHAYNLMTVENKEEVSISYLSVMLEGQVAALSSGYLTSQEALDLLDGLKASALFRDDQYSYILYPNKDLPRFDKKNNIPSSKVEQSDLLKQLIKVGDNQIIEKDVLGGYHFNGNFHNAKSLKEALSNLPKGQYQSLVEKDSKFLLDVFEDVFNHKAFTGRSGTFFGYEGLGSIYWHMVSKLLLAVQESCLKAINDNENDKLVGKLLDHYYEIEAGIGVHKSPSLYGAIPTDPYSHTPEGKGAQQPGMTGQVKEDILSRIGELGVFVKEGKLMFKPSLLRKNEFLRTPKVYRYVDVNQNFKDIALQENSLAFTYCQIPIIYKIAKKEHLKVVYNNGSAVEFESLRIDVDTSRKVFGRSGEINQIIVSITK